MSKHQTLMVYSESGGASKTTTAVSIAATAAAAGKSVLLIDLDPRAAATKWLGVTPQEDWQHVGAILGDENPEGWARSVSNREADRADHAELRLRTSLIGVEADLVVLDCPNRQGGPLTLAALNAADTVVYAATATTDGVDGVAGARRSVQHFKRSRELIGAPVNLVEAGIIVGAVQETIMSRIAAASIDQLRDTGMLLTPLVPHRTIVQEMRLTQEWYGSYRKGLPVVEAYKELARKIIR